MPRRPNTKSTNIYWLFDMRPEVIAAGHPNGFPFYCGKTVQKIEYRLNAHGHDISNHPERPLYVRLRECGKHVRTQLMEIVPFDSDWCVREKSWIRTLRGINPDCVNVSDGGGGAPGNVVSERQKTIMREKMLGRTVSPETRAKMSARMKGTSIRKGKKATPEVRAAMSAARTGRKMGPHSPEWSAKISAAQKGREMPEEHRLKLVEAWKTRRKTPVSAETRAKISVAGKGREFSEEHRANLKEAWIRRKAQDNKLTVGL